MASSYSKARSTGPTSREKVPALVKGLVLEDISAVLTGAAGSVHPHCSLEDVNSVVSVSS